MNIPFVPFLFSSFWTIKTVVGNLLGKLFEIVHFGLCIYQLIVNMNSFIQIKMVFDYSIYFLNPNFYQFYLNYKFKT